jgi:DNA polymerase-3 subunit epsilon
MKRLFNTVSLSSYPDTPGIYCFYGINGELLYVGKSKGLRSRIRAHFATPRERTMMRRVHRIEIQETAGELGALLLESKLIKELKPFHNRASRQRRRIIVALKSLNKQGYAVITLKAIDYFSIDASTPVLGIFKHRTQAAEYMAEAAKSYRLCPKLLKLERSQRYCFSYHLGRCDGACMGEEDPALYNTRLEQAFEARRIKAWPFQGAVAYEESSPDKQKREVFLLDNWCLLGSYSMVDGELVPAIKTQHRFDFDSYKILYSFLTDEKNRNSIALPGKEQVHALLQKVRIAKTQN